MPVLNANLLKKVIRVFIFAFIAVDPLPALLGVLSGSQPLDTSALRAAAVAGAAAVVALLWNLIMDPSPIPSLKIDQGAK
jgi:hypothetical protein